ncbi:MAG: hypothetical protein K8R58_14785, partial [Bacteroidales bacterium]|nr:hypothetical protein [Bacteroidales bacterium]
AYTLCDGKILFINATLGALITSKEMPVRNSFVRVMVGDYKVNDENFEDANNITVYDVGDISLPIDDDYFGIRRSLWLATDKIYKSAAENYKTKIWFLSKKTFLKKIL